jgi:hypothetical protein
MRQRWFPAFWIGLAAAVLVGDFLAGPLISLSVLFVLPVALAARCSGRGWGCGLAIFMPLAHFGYTFLWQAPWTLDDAIANAAIRIAVLVIFAVLIDRVTKQEGEIKVLRGLLPVCAYCKKIRTDDQRWQSIESYITARSEASFTHTFCPECFQEHYGKYATLLGAADAAPAQTAPPDLEGKKG